MNIFVFHIENKKEDFALAFRFVLHGCQVLRDEKYARWASQHIRFIPYHAKAELKSENIYRISINDYERNILQAKQIKTGFCEEFSNEDIFYFRVAYKASNDIVNLHYYFLASKNCRRKCCLAIILYENAEKTAFAISNYLACEMLPFGESRGFYVNKLFFNDGKHHEAEYKIELQTTGNEEVFILKKRNSIYFCQSLFRKGLSISEKFFPLLRINNELLFAFARTAIDLYSAISNVRTNKKFFNDLLYGIAHNNGMINLQNMEEIYAYFEEDHEIIEYFDEGTRKSKQFLRGKELPLPDVDLTRDILADYCKKCIDNIKKSLSKSNKEWIDRKLNEISRNVSALAFCILLSFWSRLKDENFQIAHDEVDDILTDAQDFADGILQLIENAVMHVDSIYPENKGEQKGLFCFRIHSLNHDNPQSDGILNRLFSMYGVEKADTKYYLEVLVSDFNEKADIPEKFKQNICKDMDKPLHEKEYSVSTELLGALESFELRDLFDYDSNEQARNLWQQFYHSPQNLISHYGLLIFAHLVSFAKGAFHVYSSKSNIILPNSVFKNHSGETRTTQPHIPGTQYEILLPIGVARNPHQTGLDVDIPISSEYSEWSVLQVPEECYELLSDVIFTEKYLSIGKECIVYPRNKQNLIKKVKANIQDALKKLPEQGIACIDVANISTPISIEVFAKIIISLLFDNLININRIAIINSSDCFLSTFTRVFSLVYMKTGQGKFMKDKQVYLCSYDANKEMVFCGSSLHESLNATEKIAVQNKGIPIREYKILQRESEKADEHITSEQSLSKILPYEVIINDELFRNKVEHDLYSSITNKDFGCCLENTHMRIGSKIHIHGNFYEASLLFSNSNYVTRFAYFLIKNSIDILVKRLKEDFSINKIVIIGYETYSENLVVLIKEKLTDFLKPHLNGQHPKVEYMIYDESDSVDKFGHWKIARPDEKTIFIVIVPIGSTLTTQDKIVADLIRKAKSEKQNITTKAIALHHSVVLIRDSAVKGKDGLSTKEKLFWLPINSDRTTKVIKYKPRLADIGADNLIYYFVSVESEWLLPNECRYCFPKQDRLIEEEPLIQSNKASVVPMTMIGLTGEYDRNGITSEKESIIKLLQNKTIDQDCIDLFPLRQGLCYGHVTRDEDNHFEYYFQTDVIIEEILKDESRKNDFTNKWLLPSVEQEREQTNNSIFVYDFIVAPLHNTNANFVYEVNKILDAKQIIWLDIKREFRDNIRTKYSNLTTLYHNCKNDNVNAIIKFHFVDDAINSGFSFYRAESIIRSLFETKAFTGEESVRVELFSSVFLLLNRCSKSTQANFVLDPDKHFHAYFTLNISSMRNHYDACIACTNLKNFEAVIPGRSSTNAITVISLKRAEKYFKRPSEKIVKKIDMILPRDQLIVNPNKEENLSEEQENQIELMMSRNYYRLITTHRLNKMLIELGDHKNKASIVRMYIWSQLEEICALNYATNEECFIKAQDLFFSVLKVISRPFLSFRKSVLEAALGVILEITDFTLNQNHSCLKNHPKLCDFIYYIINNRDNETKMQLIKLLLSCLANMRSTFLIRTSTINSILRLCREWKGFDNNRVSRFIQEYVFYAKQVICLGGKSNLSVWLEKLLSSKNYNEPFPQNRIGINNGAYTDELLYLLRIENIAPICDALEQCDRAWERFNRSEPDLDNVIKNTLSHYYCKTYCDFVNINQNENFEEFSKHCTLIFKPILQLFALLGDVSPNYSSQERDYYLELLNYAKDILNANEIGLYIHIKRDEKSLKIPTDGIYQLFPQKTNNEIYKNLEEYVYEISHNIIDESINIGNTFYSKIAETTRISSIKIVYTYANSDDFSEFYLVFDSQTTESIIDVISRARNLLSVRERLMKRLSSDFNDHIRNELLELQQKIQMLSNDKVGSHTPFRELSETFYALKKHIDDLPEDTIIDNKIYANQLKVIADSVISKLYVHTIMSTNPIIFDLSEIDLDVPEDASEYEKILKLVIKGSVLVGTYTVTLDDDSVIEVNWKNGLIPTPAKFGYIWCCAFIAIFHNGLRHGSYKKDEKGNTRVDISVKEETVENEKKIIIRNKLREGGYDINNHSVTLDALTYYFEKYYSKGKFKYYAYKEDGQDYFAVELPWLSKEEE